MMATVVYRTVQLCLWLAFCWLSEKCYSYWGKTVEFDDSSDAECGVVFDDACSSVFRTALPIAVQ